MFKSRFLHARGDQKKSWDQIFMNLIPQMAKIGQRKAYFGQTSMNIFKIKLRHVLSWTGKAKDPKFYESGTFVG